MRWTILLFASTIAGLSGSRYTVKPSNYIPPEKQLLEPPPAPSFSGVTHTAWTRRDGAPGSISCLAQTKDGYLWVGSTLGLYRFDGLHFSSYPFGSAGSALPSLDVASLAADLEGGLWVALRNSHVVHLKADGSRVAYDQSSGLTGSIIDRVMALPDGSVWISGSSKLFRLEGERWSNFGDSHGLGRGGVFSVFFDREGSIWIGRDKRLSVLKRGRPKFEDVPVSVHYISSMAQSRTGEIWVSDAWRTVHTLSDTTPQGAFHIQGKAEMLLDSDDNLWIAEEDEGLSRIKHTSAEAASRLLEHSSPGDLSASQTHALLEDREGNIWVGTEHGLDRYQKTAFTHFRSTRLRYFPSLVAADDGAVWINSHGSPLMRVIDGKTIPVGNHVNSGPLAKRRNGDICFADLTTYELQCYGKDHAEHIKMPDALEHAPPLGLIEDDDGSLLFSFQGRGFWRDHDGAWERLHAPGLSGGSPWAMLSDSHGRLWLGYGHNKVTERKNGIYKTLAITDGAWSNTLTFYEAAGTIWAAGSSGLCFLDGEQWRRVHSLGADLLKGSSGIVLDKFNNLWLNAGAGVLRIPAGEVAQVLRDHQRSVKVDVFDENDGLVGQPTQFKRTPSAVADARGTLWFAAGGDVVSLDPANLLGARPLPNVLLESVFLNGKSILIPLGRSGATVHSESTGFHDLEINYIGINLSAPERTHYRYRLVGEDKGWQEVGKRRQAFYTRLNPGSYQFQVSASNGDEWTDLSLPLHVEVSPAIYQTLWFQLFCLLLAVALAWFIWRTRMRFATEQVHARLSERLAERERVARELHDTLLQGFQGLMMRFHLATQSIPSSDPARSEMEEALDSADLLLVESRDRIRDLRYETIQQASLSEALAALAEEFAEPAGWNVQVVTRGTPRDLNPVSYWEIYSVAKEALINCFRHSEASQIVATLQFDTGRFTVEVVDNGRGIDPEVLDGRKRSNHWGLSGMRERAANLRADLKFASSPGLGTTVKLSIPAQVAYQNNQTESLARLFWQGWPNRLRKIVR